MAVMSVFTIVMVLEFILLKTGAESQSAANDLNTAFVVLTSTMPSDTVSSSHVLEHEETKQENEIYRNPRTSPEPCHRGVKPAWLCNSDHVLTNENVKDLEMSLNYLYHEGNVCPCTVSNCNYNGLPMIVMVLKTINFTSVHSAEERKEKVHKLAQHFLNDWKFDTCQDGAITIVVANERLVVTVIGETSKKVISTDCQDDVTNATFGFFQDGLVYEGLQELIKQYRSIVLAQHACNIDDGSDGLKLRVLIPVILILVGIIICSVAAAFFVFFRRRESRDIKTEAQVPLNEQQQPEKV